MAGALRMNARQSLHGILLVSASAILWGMGGLFTRLLPFDLWTIIFWRGVFAVLFVGAYAVHLVVSARRSRKTADASAREGVAA